MTVRACTVGAPVNHLIFPSQQPEDAGAVITPISQMGNQAPGACTSPPGVTRNWRSLGSRPTALSPTLLAQV